MEEKRCVAFFWLFIPAPLLAPLRALWTLCSVSLWVIFLPVYCRSLPLPGLCGSVQHCPSTSQRMLITVTLNHWASLSYAYSTSANSILSPARGKVEQFTVHHWPSYPPCLNPVSQHDNARHQNVLRVGFLLKLNGMLISWLLHVLPAGWFRFILGRSGTCKWALDVIWLRAESGTVFWWHFKCVCSSMKMCLLIHASNLLTRGYLSYLLRAAGWRRRLMSQSAGQYATCRYHYVL